MIHYMKQGDLLPSISGTLLDPHRKPYDLTGKDVIFIMDGLVMGEAVIEDPLTGFVRYDWKPGDTDLPGSWKAEFRILYPSGRLRTVPNKGYITVEIARSLEGVM